MLRTGLQVEGRADGLADFAERPQLLDRARQVARPGLELLQQTDVFDGDHGLVREGGHQLDLPVREFPHLGPPQDDGADQLPLSQHGNAQHRPEAADLLEVGLLVLGIGEDIGYLHRPVTEPHPRHARPAPGPSLLCFPEVPQLGGGAVESPHVKHLTIEAIDESVGSVAQLGGILHERLEHGLQLERRAADEFQHLAGCRLLLQRLAQVRVGCRELARARLDFLFEARVGLLQLGGRPVELLSEGFQLVARPDLDPVAEVARADPRRAILQHTDRRHHPPGQHDARQDGEPEAGHEEDAAQHDRALQGSEGLRERLLGEHQPAERLDGGVAREHPPPLDAGRLAHDVARGGRRPRRADLRQPREVAVLEDQAHVGMGDENAALVDHVHVARDADVDLRDDVPDDPEVDLRRRDLRSALPPGHGDGEVRLGLVAKVHRPEVRASDSRLHEAGILREVAPAADLVRREAGHQQLHLARRIELDELGDGGHVAEQAQEVDLALLPRQRRIGEGHLHRRPHLLLDSLHELLDARGGRQGLLALEPDERRLRLPVGEVEVDEAAQEQHPAHEQDQDGRVLAEEPAVRGRGPHRRMMSARKRTCRGAVRPREAAVLRLTARMMRSAPSTGRSRGRAPRRIFATSRAAWTPCAR